MKRSGHHLKKLPDIFGIINVQHIGTPTPYEGPEGRFLAIEVKKSEKEMYSTSVHAKEQDAMIDKLNREGALAFKTYSWEHTQKKLLSEGYL